MDRRRFLLTSLAGALATPLAAMAQQDSKVFRIGAVSAGAPRSSPHWVAFARRLGELGYVEGRNLSIEYAGLRLQEFEFRDPPYGFDGPMKAAARQQAGALLGLASPIFFRQRVELAEMAIRHRLPAIVPFRESAEAGVLMAYGAYLPDMLRRAAEYVDRILKGAKTADLPMEQPTKFELTIHLKTAKALGLTLPPSLLLRADHLIE